jgi:hypothetical protein
MIAAALFLTSPAEVAQRPPVLATVAGDPASSSRASVAAAFPAEVGIGSSNRASPASAAESGATRRSSSPAR